MELLVIIYSDARQTVSLIAVAHTGHSVRGRSLNNAELKVAHSGEQRHGLSPRPAAKLTAPHGLIQDSQCACLI